MKTADRTSRRSKPSSSYAPPLNLDEKGHHKMADNSAIRIIEDKVHEIEHDRKYLVQECELLRSENKWFRKKVAELEKCLVVTESKHSKLKKQQEEQEKLISSMHQSMLEVTLDLQNETQKQKEKNWFYEYKSEKVEKEYAIQKLKQIEKEKLKLETELFDLRIANEKLTMELSKKSKLENELHEMKITRDKLSLELMSLRRKEEDFNNKVKQEVKKDMKDLEGKKQELKIREEKWKLLIREQKRKVKSRYKHSLKLIQAKMQKYKRRIRQLEDLYKESVLRVSELEHQQIESVLKETVHDEEEKRIQQPQVAQINPRTTHQHEIPAKVEQTSTEHMNIRLDNQHLQHIEQLQRDHIQLEKQMESVNLKLQEALDQNKTLANRLEESTNYITSLNNELQNHVTQLESAWDDNTSLKQTINRLNNRIHKLENKKKLLKKEVEYKDTEVAKRNRFISNLVTPTLNQVLNNNPHAVGTSTTMIPPPTTTQQDDLSRSRQIL